MVAAGLNHLKHPLYTGGFVLVKLELFLCDTLEHLRDANSWTVVPEMRKEGARMNANGGRTPVVNAQRRVLALAATKPNSEIPPTVGVGFGESLKEVLLDQAMRSTTFGPGRNCVHGLLELRQVSTKPCFIGTFHQLRPHLARITIMLQTLLFERSAPSNAVQTDFTPAVDYSAPFSNLLSYKMCTLTERLTLHLRISYPPKSP